MRVGTVDVVAIGDARRARRERRQRWRRAGQRGVLDDRDRRLRAEACLHQALRDRRGNRAAHVDGDGRAGERQPCPIRQHFARGVLAGGEDEARRGTAERQRDFRLCCGSKRGGDAGHDFERNSRRTERRHLLAGAAEDERIAGLQPHDAASGRSLAHE